MTEKQMVVKARRVFKLYEQYKKLEEQLQAVRGDFSGNTYVEAGSLDGTERALLREFLIYSKSFRELDDYLDYDRNQAEETTQILTR